MFMVGTPDHEPDANFDLACCRSKDDRRQLVLELRSIIAFVPNHDPTVHRTPSEQWTRVMIGYKADSKLDTSVEPTTHGHIARVHHRVVPFLGQSHVVQMS